jgi:multiple sugar transport system permease protein
MTGAALNRLWQRSLLHLFIWAALLATAFPLVYTVLTSLKTFLQLVQGAILFAPTLANWQQLFSPTSDFPQLTVNSLVAATGTTAISLALGAPAAYSLSRVPWARAARTAMLGAFLLVQMLPPVMFIGPLYVVARTLRVYDTPAAVIMGHLVVTLPLAVWMLQTFFAEIPKEVEESAAIDGCSSLQVLWRVALPMALPGLAAAAVLCFTFSWVEFLFAVTLTSTPASETIPVGIAGFVQENSVRYGEMAAAAVFATIPAVVLVGFAQRYIVKGLTLGAVKG